MHQPNLRFARVSITRLGIACLAFTAQFFFTSRSFADPGDLYVTDLATGSVIIYAPDGTASTFTTGLISPQGIAFDQENNLYVADAGDGAVDSGVIFKYDLATATQTVLVDGLDNPLGMSRDGSDLLVAENAADRIGRVPLDGVHPPTVFEDITGPLSVFSKAFTGSNSGFFRYITNGPLVREIDPADPTMPTDFDFSADPSRSVTVDDDGNVFVTTDGGTVTEIPAGGGAQFVFASGFTQPTGMDFRPAKFGGDTDRVGFLYVADTATGEISQIDQAGVLTPFVTGAGMPNHMVFEGNIPIVLSKALNLSTRVDVQTGDNVGIGGFIITGTDPKLVVLRAIGPSLEPLLSDVLANPLLELHDDAGVVIATNDNWTANSPEDKMVLTDNELAPSNNFESALVMTLDPGAYTAIVKGSAGGSGIALIEAYDLDNPLAAGELGNISTRGLVGTDANVLIGGIIVGPEDGPDASFVVRAIGPSLADSGVDDPLLDPVVELKNEAGDTIAMNDNWETDPEPDNYAVEVTAADLAPTDAAESAVFANLSPGLYTAIVSGTNSTTGVGLVEVYHVESQAVQSESP